MKSVHALLDPFNRQNDPEAVIHRRTVAAKDEITAPWPLWLHDSVRETFEGLGIAHPGFIRCKRQNQFMLETTQSFLLAPRQANLWPI